MSIFIKNYKKMVLYITNILILILFHDTPAVFFLSRTTSTLFLVIFYSQLNSTFTY